MDNVEKTISEQLISLCSVPVSTETRERAALHLLDWLGCILTGAVTDPGKGVREFARQGQYASGRSFVCGEADLCASGAAFVNGGLGNILEMDDVHRASILHAGDTVIPAALAVAQEQQTSLSELLDSIVRGYELVLRIGTVAASGGYSNWYNSGTCGVFGAAFASGQVLGLDRKQLKDCLGQAGMLGSGIWQCRLESTWSKQLACANAASNGVMAALLAKQNFPGARFILEGEAGFFSTYYPNTEVERINLQSVDSWLLHEVSFKPWPACRHCHPAIEAALQLGAELGTELRVEAIEGIEIATYGAAIDFCDKPNPESAHEARFSLQHCIAVALLRGEPTLADFDKPSRQARNISALREKISVEVAEPFESRFPDHMGSGVKVTLASGRGLQVNVDNARGDPENSMSPEDVKAKFFRLATMAGLSDKTANAFVSALLLDGRSDQNYECSLDALSKALASTVVDMQKNIM